MLVHIDKKKYLPKPKPKMRLNEVFYKKSKSSMDEDTKKKLKEHSKLHKGGMKSKHIKNMAKFLSNGETFNSAHNKAKKLDKKLNKVNKKNKNNYN